MLEHIATAAAGRPSIAIRRPIGRLSWKLASAARWIGRYYQRIDLSELDDHRLRDLGLTRAQVRDECAKWPWQA